MASFDTEQIRRYYDRNTPAFVEYGQGGSIGAIHRAVWGPGVTTREQAFHFAEDRIADVVRGLAERRTTDPFGPETPHVVDLGCGVGSSLCYLAGLLPTITGTGVTLSPLQARAAVPRIAAAGLSDRVTCSEGDFGDLPTMRPADVAYAIESFVHGPDPARFFAQAARLVRPGGALVICDDVLRPGNNRRAERTIRRFKRGWHINSLLEARELQALASAAGFDHDATADLSPYLELRRPRDRAIAAAMAAVGWLPLEATRLGPLAGGSALQQGLARGWIGYDLMVFRRRPAREAEPA